MTAEDKTKPSKVSPEVRKQIRRMLEKSREEQLLAHDEVKKTGKPVMVGDSGILHPN